MYSLSSGRTCILLDQRSLPKVPGMDKLTVGSAFPFPTHRTRTGTMDEFTVGSAFTTHRTRYGRTYCCIIVPYPPFQVWTNILLNQRSLRNVPGMVEHIVDHRSLPTVPGMVEHTVGSSFPTHCTRYGRTYCWIIVPYPPYQVWTNILLNQRSLSPAPGIYDIEKAYLKNFIISSNDVCANYLSFPHLPLMRFFLRSPAIVIYIKHDHRIGLPRHMKDNFSQSLICWNPITNVENKSEIWLMKSKIAFDWRTF